MTFLLQLTQPWVFLTFYIIVHSDLSSSHKKPLGLETNLTLVYLSLYLTLAFESQGLVQYCLSDFFFRWLSSYREGARVQGRLHRHRPQLLGHPQWTCYRWSSGADDPWPGTIRTTGQVVAWSIPQVPMKRTSSRVFLFFSNFYCENK